MNNLQQLVKEAKKDITQRMQTHENNLVYGDLTKPVYLDALQITVDPKKSNAKPNIYLIEFEQCSNLRLYEKLLRALFTGQTTEKVLEEFKEVDSFGGFSMACPHSIEMPNKEKRKIHLEIDVYRIDDPLLRIMSRGHEQYHNYTRFRKIIGIKDSQFNDSITRMFSIPFEESDYDEEINAASAGILAAKIKSYSDLSIINSHNSYRGGEGYKSFREAVKCLLRGEYHV